MLQFSSMPFVDLDFLYVKAGIEVLLEGNSVLVGVQTAAGHSIDLGNGLHLDAELGGHFVPEHLDSVPVQFMVGVRYGQ